MVKPVQPVNYSVGINELEIDVGILRSFKIMKVAT